ncbi:MAG: transposase [Bacteroidia bacterium]
MKTSQFSLTQRKAIVSQRQTGASVEEICRMHQISPATFYNWEKVLKEDQDEDKRRIKQLEQENARLKKMYEDSPAMEAAIADFLGLSSQKLSVYIRQIEKDKKPDL